MCSPGRYVGAEEIGDDDEAFADKMQKLTEKLGEQMAKGAELDAVIRAKAGAGVWVLNSEAFGSRLVVMCRVGP